MPTFLLSVKSVHDYKCKGFTNSIVELGLMDVNRGETNKEREGRSVFIQGGWQEREKRIVNCLMTSAKK
jgi:hypothetical protein